MAKVLTRVFLTMGLPLATMALLALLDRYQRTELLDLSKPIEEPSFQWMLFVSLIALIALFPRRFQRWACLSLMLIHLAVVFLDSAYFRFFQDLPSFYLLPTWMQAGRVGDSVSNLMSAKDLLLVLPVLSYLALLWAERRWAPSRERDWRVSLTLVGLCALGWVVVWKTVHPVRHEQLQRRFQNKAIANIFGTTFYHYYDFVEWARVTAGLEGGKAFDKNLVAKVVGRSRELSSEDTPVKGAYEGRDLIFLQLESLEYFALEAEYQGRPVMPFLHQAKERVATFRLFDQTHLGRSADGQFIYLNSLQPPAARPLPFVYPNNKYFGLPWLLREKGYSTFYFEPVEASFWNAGAITVSYGFENRYFKNDLPPKDRKRDVRGWGLTDGALFDQVLDAVEKSDDPYFAYVVTVMCHHPYSATSNPTVDFPPAKKTSMVRRYLRCAAARDLAVKNLLMRLSTTERGRRTVICLAGDHDANLSKPEMKKLGYPVYPENETVPAMIGTVEEFLGSTESPLKTHQLRDFGGQMDLAPTLGHVFSLNMEESVFVGWNLFATQNRGPHHCRVGTVMDQTGRIQLEEDARLPDEDGLFEASEMLLRWDRIRGISLEKDSKV